jgi:integrase
MKAEKFPVTVTEGGVSAKVRKVSQINNGKTYTRFIADYVLLGERKQVGRACFEEAKEIALNACRQIASGNQLSLTLANSDRMTYIRATEALTPVGIALDTACREYADARQILGGKASLAEACREWMNRNASIAEKINVAEGAKRLLEQLQKDGKSQWRLKGVTAALTSLGNHFNGQPVDTVTPAQLSAYLSGLAHKQRTKKNHRDVIGFFNRWLCTSGYLTKGVNWLDGVQDYKKRKTGEITIYQPDEMKEILAVCKADELPTVAIGAFSALRHAEICRLRWEDIELSEKPGESFISVASIEDTKTDQRRRLVPISENLKAWLRKCQKSSGLVTTLTYEQSCKHLPHLARRAKVTFKRNAFRHSGISYRAAQCQNVPMVAEESGNSVAIVRSNYLRVVKPSQAAEWFAILP